MGCLAQAHTPTRDCRAPPTRFRGPARRAVVKAGVLPPLHVGKAHWMGPQLALCHVILTHASPSTPSQPGVCPQADAWSGWCPSVMVGRMDRQQGDAGA